MRNRFIAPILVALALFAFALPGAAQLRFVEGMHYERIDEPLETPDGAVEVIEFFSYGCSHCRDFEPHLQEWKTSLPDHVAFQAVPAGLGRQAFQQLAAIYYIADELGVLDQSHAAMFEEIHVKQNRAIMSREGLLAFFGQFGIDADALEQAMVAQGVQERFARGEAQARAAGLMGVPMVVVAGKYRVMRNQHVTDYDSMLEVIDFLVEQEAGDLGS